MMSLRFAAGFAALACICLCFPALAQTGAGGAVGTAPAAQPGVISEMASLYGPLCGLLVAVIIFFDRVAKIIPNSTDIKILAGLRKVAAVLGVKVPDVQ